MSTLCPCICLMVHRSKYLYDLILLLKNEECEEYEYKEIEKNDVGRSAAGYVALNRRGFNSYLLSAYTAALKNSKSYRNSAAETLAKFLHINSAEVVALRLRTPRKQFLDYKWNERIVRMAEERREVDYAMSWLSTLGGAFSALGDEFQHCAEMAGQISLRQLQLALRFGDPLLLARCRLYTALSLLQRDRLRTAKKMIREIHAFALLHDDTHLRRMCQGVWAKLKYKYKTRATSFHV